MNDLSLGFGYLSVCMYIYSKINWSFIFAGKGTDQTDDGLWVNSISVELCNNSGLSSGMRPSVCSPVVSWGHTLAAVGRMPQTNKEVTELAIKLRPLRCHMTSLYLMLPWWRQINTAITLLKAYGKSKTCLLSMKALTCTTLVNTGNIAKGTFLT